MTQAPMVLIADPDREALATTSRVLSNKGFRLGTARSADECLERMALDRPDVLLAAWAVPKLTGVELCRRIRQEPAYPLLLLRVPAIEDVEEGSADSYLPERCGAALLISAVEALVAARDIRVRLAAAEAEVLRSREEFSRFAARVNHDFAEPFRTMTALTQLLDKGSGSTLMAEEKLYLEYLVQGMDRVRALLKSLMAYAQLGTFPVSYGPVSLSLAAASAVNALKVSIERTGTDVRIKEPLPMVRGNAQQLTTVFQSLLQNAINYRRSDSAVTVVVKAVREESGEWQISVSDNGEGIAPQYHQSVFEPFQRLHGRDIPGSGLGLTQVRKILEGHHGRIWLESEPGKGTTVSFTLPAQDS
jgi:signal transduction histidine kinase